MLFAVSITIISTWLALGSQTALAASRTVPPEGALIVRGISPGPGEYPNVSSAVDALPKDNRHHTIFIYPGIYTEQVYIGQSDGLTIIGHTDDDTSYMGNQVTIQHNLSTPEAGGSDDGSGTLRIHTDDFKMYNVNVKNTFGIGSQAIAISQYGNRAGLYGCGFFGFQDTVLAEQGAQVYLKCYIEGAVDFIFGQEALAYFGGNTIAVKRYGSITASGRASNNNSSYVFNYNKIVLAPDAALGTGTAGRVSLGRPWRDYAKVIWLNTETDVQLNKRLWSPWQLKDSHTDHVYFAEYNITGPGSHGLSPATFSVQLTSRQAKQFTIGNTVGENYMNWVDLSYIV